MDFSLSKTEELFLQMIREFAEKEVKPLAAEVDEEERFPLESCREYAVRQAWYSRHTHHYVVPLLWKTAQRSKK